MAGLKLAYDEGQTPLDESELEGLKIQTVETQGELDEYEQRNIEDGMLWISRQKLNSEKILTEKFVENLHKKMFGSVWKWAGIFRQTEKNIGVAWIRVGIELNKLLGNVIFWIENDVFPPKEIAIRFHHELVKIHCFSNGNGRHSRVMADILLKALSDGDTFSWNNSNMVKADEIRKEYIKALKSADNGDIQPLMEFASN